jgi:serine/threonine-protein kinase HipA
VYDMLTITVYDDYAKNPPAMSVDGRSTWMPGKALERFIQTRCNVMPARTLERVERICEAIVQVTPQVVEATKRYPAFRETGKRMLHAWNDGMNSLRLQKTWSLPSLDKTIAAAGFSDLVPAQPTKLEKIGRSPLLGQR